MCPPLPQKIYTQNRDTLIEQSVIEYIVRLTVCNTIKNPSLSMNTVTPTHGHT